MQMIPGATNIQKKLRQTIGKLASPSLIYLVLQYESVSRFLIYPIAIHSTYR